MIQIPDKKYHQRLDALFLEIEHLAQIADGDGTPALRRKIEALHDCVKARWISQPMTQYAPALAKITRLPRS